MKKTTQNKLAIEQCAIRLNSLGERVHVIYEDVQKTLDDLKQQQQISKNLEHLQETLKVTSKH